MGFSCFCGHSQKCNVAIRLLLLLQRGHCVMCGCQFIWIISEPKPPICHPFRWTHPPPECPKSAKRKTLLVPKCPNAGVPKYPSPPPGGDQSSSCLGVIYATVSVLWHTAQDFSVGWSLLQAVKQKYNYDEGLHSPNGGWPRRGRKSSSAALSLNKYMWSVSRRVVKWDSYISLIRGIVRYWVILIGLFRLLKCATLKLALSLIFNQLFSNLFICEFDLYWCTNAFTHMYAHLFIKEYFS